MKGLCIILLIFCSGCMNPFDTSDHERLLIMYTRQVAIQEQEKHKAEVSEAVRNFQIQAIKAGLTILRCQ